VEAWQSPEELLQPHLLFPAKEKQGLKQDWQQVCIPKSKPTRLETTVSFVSFSAPLRLCV
jgi:hypothetical protein